MSCDYFCIRIFERQTACVVNSHMWSCTTARLTAIGKHEVALLKAFINIVVIKRIARVAHCFFTLNNDCKTWHGVLHRKKAKLHFSDINNRFFVYIDNIKIVDKSEIMKYFETVVVKLRESVKINVIESELD